ncbi:hypothetical protein HPB50_014316 [Hyalomma asiaticum]|uniref:Uncharacterized protein n=1 Tax=Hyalomma asiaticum TaxID=266040 RepID=A0ACB7RKV7_HYAAI|nr:hypothetical protein HPB50_014316 [Hyalomma asiaticum]
MCQPAAHSCRLRNTVATTYTGSVSFFRGFLSPVRPFDLFGDSPHQHAIPCTILRCLRPGPPLVPISSKIAPNLRFWPLRRRQPSSRLRVNLTVAHSTLWSLLRSSEEVDQETAPAPDLMERSGVASRHAPCPILMCDAYSLSIPDYASAAGLAGGSHHCYAELLAGRLAVRPSCIYAGGVGVASSVKNALHIKNLCYPGPSELLEVLLLRLRRPAFYIFDSLVHSRKGGARDSSRASRDGWALDTPSSRGYANPGDLAWRTVSQVWPVRRLHGGGSGTFGSSFYSDFDFCSCSSHDYGSVVLPSNGILISTDLGLSPPP